MTVKPVFLLFSTLAVAMPVGCGSRTEAPKKPGGSIVGKTTQDISEFKPEAGEKVSDSKVNVTNPVTGPLQAYGPILENLSKTAIAQALNFFNAEQGRYPNSYEEFMAEIIQKNNIRLPVLPGDMKYKYDVEKHELVVVKAAE